MRGPPRRPSFIITSLSPLLPVALAHVQAEARSLSLSPGWEAGTLFSIALAQGKLRDIDVVTLPVLRAAVTSAEEDGAPGRAEAGNAVQRAEKAARDAAVKVARAAGEKECVWDVGPGALR